MLTQLMDCRMIVTLDLIGQRQIARIDYAHLGAEQDEQAGRLLHRKPAERTRAQRTIEQQDTRRWIERGSEEHTSELQSLMRISYDVLCSTKKKYNITHPSLLSLIYNNILDYTETSYSNK